MARETCQSRYSLWYCLMMSMRISYWKVFAEFLFAAALVFSVAGCLTVEQEMTLREDASGTSSLKICVDQKFYQDDNFRTEYEPIIRKVFDDLENSPGSITLLRSEEDYDNSHCYEASHEFGNINEIAGSDFTFSYRTDGNQKVLRARVFFREMATESQWIRFKDENTADNGRLSFRFTLPLRVTEVIGGRIKEQMAIWDLPIQQVIDSRMKDLSMTASANIRSFSIGGTYSIEGGKSRVRKK